jgi:hypothetical protein
MKMIGRMLLSALNPLAGTTRQEQSGLARDGEDPNRFLPLLVRSLRKTERYAERGRKQGAHHRA